jgi:integrin alpha FG-GAP repeat containing protein 1
MKFIVFLDFDGDAFMDVMFTTNEGSEKIGIYVSWGESEKLNCSSETSPLVIMKSEPLALDYNDDMIIDLFGLDENGERTFWIFDKSRTAPKPQKMKLNSDEKHELSVPHSHAFLDLNDDFHADLFLTRKDDKAEIWLSDESSSESRFVFNRTIDYGVGTRNLFGQSVFVDMELNGELNHLVPVCHNRKCTNSSIWVHSGEHFHNLNINFYQNDNKTLWGFMQPDENEFYKRTITLRSGDFNNDGFPDLLCTLQKSDGTIQTFLMENVKNEDARNSDKFKRTFIIRWDALLPFGENTIMGSFYDFFQDGILDVVMLQKNGKKYKPLAFRNTLDYDANFVKVIVLTGLTNKRPPSKKTAFGAKRRNNYGTNLPGPRIKYYTTTQEGTPQHGGSCQLPQSAYLSLHLPYTIFGLGRTPNFVDFIEIGLARHSRKWPQTIPNSQLFVIPSPLDKPKDWKIQLFVTPSKIIFKSVFALLGICFVISVIIIALHIKERRQDKLEKLQEAQRFHFDAM